MAAISLTRSQIARLVLGEDLELIDGQGGCIDIYPDKPEPGEVGTLTIVDGGVSVKRKGGK